MLVSLANMKIIMETPHKKDGAGVVSQLLESLSSGQFKLQYCPKN
jgi:hypothetical protein